MNVKRLLALLLALGMIMSLAACGGGNTQPAADDSANTATNEPADEGPVDEGPAEIDDRLMADVQTQDDFDQAAFDAASDEIYDEILGEFYDLYMTAKDEVSDTDLRMALMAIAEAKMLESGAYSPGQANAGGLYAISKIIPHSAPSVVWGFDGDTLGRALKNLLIVNEILTPDVRAELTAKWTELKGTGTWNEWAKQWAADNGYTLYDYITITYAGEPSTWDALASYQSTVGDPVSLLTDTLLTYDCEDQLQPALAESYEVSEDGLTYTFHLRQGSKWVTYQGTEFGEVKADDFVAGLQHAADANIGLASVLFGAIENYEAYAYGEITDFDQVGVKALDDYTVEYTLEVPCPWFDTLTGYSLMYPMSRDYYTSQGGKFGADFDAAASDYQYGTDPQHILYNGPYLISNYTYQNRMVFTENPSFRDAANTPIKTITMLYNDGTDPTFGWTNFMNGTLNASVSLTGENLELAKTTKVEDEEEDVTYFDKYAYVSAVDATSMFSAINVNRFAYANYNDETAVRSPQTVTDAQRTNAAVSNRNFRLALNFALDRGALGAIAFGEELKYNRLINSYVPGTLVSLSKDVTVDINGTATTFPAGTYYGEILQAQIDADGFPVQVWDPNGNDGVGSSSGFDGWYNPATAAEYLDKAIEELGADGIEISAENPIYIDISYMSFSTVYGARDQATKQSIEAALGGKVIINLVDTVDVDTFYYATYYGNTGYTMNYDFAYGASGWSPDYGDAQSYLDTLLPGGSMVIVAGIG